MLRCTAMVNRTPRQHQRPAAAYLGPVVLLFLRCAFCFVPRLVVGRFAFLLTFTVIFAMRRRTTRDVSTDCRLVMLLLKLIESFNTSAGQMT